MARVHDLGDAWKENIGKLRDQVEDVRDRFEEATDKAKAKGEETWKDGIKFVQKHPLESLGVALVVGAALGIILSGGKRD